MSNGASVPAGPQCFQDPGRRTIPAALYAVVLIAIVAGTIYCGWLLPPERKFIAIACLMTAFLMVLGYHTKSSLLGALITDKNVMSLSRFQLFVWSIIILAGYFAFAFTRMVKGLPDALNIFIDPQIYALIGITTASPLLAPTVLQLRNKDIYTNDSSEQADFTDIFEGDETGNGTVIDFSKVQMFFFTIVAACCFAVNLYHLLAAVPPGPVADGQKILGSFPALSEGFLWLLGLSHLGYLGNKAVPQTGATKAGQGEAAGK